MQMSGLCEHVSGSGKVLNGNRDSQENSSFGDQRTLVAFGFRTENYTTYSIHYKYFWINDMNVSFVLTYIDIKVH